MAGRVVETIVGRVLEVIGERVVEMVCERMVDLLPERLFNDSLSSVCCVPRAESFCLCRFIFGSSFY
jgi:hypothetical protein